MIEMNSKERVRAIIEKKPVDRVAIAGWKHFPLVDRKEDKFIQKTIEFTEKNKWDIIKLMSQGQFFAEAYGAEIEFSTNPKEWSGRFEKYLLYTPEDLETIKPLAMNNPVLQREVRVAKGVADYFKGTKVIIGTIFTPLSWIKQFAPGNSSIAHLHAAAEVSPLPIFLKDHKEALHQVLKALNETNKILMDSLIEAGVDGFFIAEQFGSRDTISKEDYDEFCRPYITDLLEYVKDRTWFNMLHVHGTDHLMLEEMLDYDVQSFNWEAVLPPAPEADRVSFHQLRSLTDKVLVGGIEPRQDLNVSTDREEIKELLRKRLNQILQETGDSRLVFAPGCAFSLDIDEDLFSLIYEVAKEHAVTLNK